MRHKFTVCYGTLKNCKKKKKYRKPTKITNGYMYTRYVKVVSTMFDLLLKFDCWFTVAFGDNMMITDLLLWNKILLECFYI